MLEPFKGEFFMHPAALDYSGNTCSNACAYCFASLRSEERRAQVRKISNLCLGKADGTSHTDWLFNQGYPVCMSNRSDPFATSNRDNTGVVLQLMDMVPNGVFFQTKGLSRGVDYSLLDGFKKKNVVMYITIDTLNDEICKRIEPGAPLPQQRIELAAYAKSRGWFVEVGLNPCVREWMPDGDFETLVGKLDDAGVDGYFLQNLSLNKVDVSRMNAARRARLDEKAVIDAVEDRVGDAGDHDAFVRRYFWLVKNGKVAHIGITPLKSRLMALECEHLGKAVTPVCSFVDYAWDENERTGKNVYTFSDFLGFMTKGNEEMLSYSHGDLYKYIMVVNRALWKSSNRVKSARTFTDVYNICWNMGGVYNSPQNRFCFAKIVGSDGKAVRDEFGNIQLYFLGRDEEMRRKHARTVSVGEIEGKEVRT